jgi:hypothetical protein
MKYGIAASIVCLLAGWALHGAIESAAPSKNTPVNEVQGVDYATTLDADDANSVLQYANQLETTVDDAMGDMNAVLASNKSMLSQLPEVTDSCATVQARATKVKAQCRAVRESALNVVRGDNSEVAQNRMARELSRLVVLGAKCTETSVSLGEALKRKADELTAKAALPKRRPENDTNSDVTSFAAALLRNVLDGKLKVIPGMAKADSAIADNRKALLSHPRLATAILEYEEARDEYLTISRKAESAANRVLNGDVSDEAQQEVTVRAKEFETITWRMARISDTMAKEFEKVAATYR